MEQYEVYAKCRKLIVLFVHARALQIGTLPF
jgi:hypothetical protein